ncbi:hypothetical protein PIB30_003256 [Stylosanthes scabra]|uniref:Uncharacterized protein n=1 Tax=Stylosanthes scabra TaxID=79078 RepID=A0ABU6R2B5_9FABA|nr:hypothetical protein [Stylosanthes scabra]
MCFDPATEVEAELEGVAAEEEEGSKETLYRINRDPLGEWDRNEEVSLTESVGGEDRDVTDLAWNTELVNQGERLFRRYLVKRKTRMKLVKPEQSGIEVGFPLKAVTRKTFLRGL